MELKHWGIFAEPILQNLDLGLNFLIRQALFDGQNWLSGNQLITSGFRNTLGFLAP